MLIFTMLQVYIHLSPRLFFLSANFSFNFLVSIIGSYKCSFPKCICELELICLFCSTVSFQMPPPSTPTKRSVELSVSLSWPARVTDFVCLHYIIKTTSINELEQNSFVSGMQNKQFSFLLSP